MANDIHLVIGIGNPGREYDGTRHNVGFAVADALAEEAGVRFKKATSRIAAATIDSFARPLVVIKPLTFVNNSGMIVPFLRDKYGVTQSPESPSPVESWLVVCDDIHLPTGKLRVRRGGASGGHNGLKSLIAAVGSDAIPRIRIGIGNPEGEDQAEYVLRRFGRSEQTLVNEGIEKTRDAVKLWLGKGIDACMNAFNAKETQ